MCIRDSGGGYHRSVAVEEIYYNEDGTIEPVDFTDEGVYPVEDLDPVSYTHLDVYKRQAMHHLMNILQKNFLSILISGLNCGLPEICLHLMNLISSI